MLTYAIGIDIGTGSTKAIAVSTTGEVIAQAQYYYPLQNIPPSYVEQDPELIWEAFVKSIQHITSQIKEPPAVISLSSYMHGIMAVDAQCAALTNVITWADNRSQAIAEELRKSPEAEKLYKTSGTPIHSMLPLTKIIWMKRHEESVFRHTAKFISIKEYIWYRIFHTFEVDHSIASATGLFDIEQLRWSYHSLQLCGITTDHLSQPVPTRYIRNDVRKKTATELNIPADTRFCIGASDGCMANLGSMAFEQGVAALTIGSSGAVRIASPKPVYNYAAMTFNYILDANTFICGGPVNNGGNVVQWLMSRFLNKSSKETEDYTELFDLIAHAPPRSKGLLFLPYLYGERAPIWDEKSCGVYIGIRENHTTDHFMRAAIEGLCFSLYHIIQNIETLTGTIHQLNVSGGFVRSKLWLHILADITGKKLCQIHTEDASAWGAVLLGMKSTGLIEEYKSIPTKSEMSIEPNIKNHQAYQESYNVFKGLYGLLKDSMHQLYTLNH